MTSLVIRPQQDQTDIDAITLVNDAAFDQHGRTPAFDEFRRHRNDIISLVATLDSNVIGHVLFSPATFRSTTDSIAGMGLGQLAVHPDHQGKGIGQRLTNRGLVRLRAQQCPFVIVVGHAGYYPRFGFEVGKDYGLKCQWEGIPDDSFMVLYPHANNANDNPVMHGTVSFDGL